MTQHKIRQNKSRLVGDIGDDVEVAALLLQQARREGLGQDTEEYSQPLSAQTLQLLNFSLRYRQLLPEQQLSLKVVVGRKGFFCEVVVKLLQLDNVPVHQHRHDERLLHAGQ